MLTAMEHPVTDLIIITCHDLGAHLGCYGWKTLQSPQLDASTAGGVRFEHAAANS